MEVKGPKVIVWLSTSKCTLNCSHCYAWLYREERDLSTEEALSLVRGAAYIGARELHFTGGEPLLRPDIFELLAEAQRLGLEVSLFTNLYMLNERSLRRIVDLAVPVFTSMEGPSKEVHEALRGPGSWDRLVEGVKALSREGVYVHVNVTVSELNAKYVGSAVRRAFELGASSASVIPAMPVGMALKLGTYVRPASFKQALLDVAKEGKEVGEVISVWCAPFAELVVDDGWLAASGCRGWRVMDVTPSGRVVACDVMNYEVAHVLLHGVREAWRRHQEDPLVKEAMSPVLEEPCASCEAWEVCRGGCYARAWLAFNDVKRPDPLCPRVAEGMGLGLATGLQGCLPGASAGPSKCGHEQSI